MIEEGQPIQRFRSKKDWNHEFSDKLSSKATAHERKIENKRKERLLLFPVDLLQDALDDALLNDNNTLAGNDSVVGCYSSPTRTFLTGEKRPVRMSSVSAKTSSSSLSRAGGLLLSSSSTSSSSASKANAMKAQQQRFMDLLPSPPRPSTWDPHLGGQLLCYLCSEPALHDAARCQGCDNMAHGLCLSRKLLSGPSHLKREHPWSFHCEHCAEALAADQHHHQRRLEQLRLALLRQLAAALIVSRVRIFLARKLLVRRSLAVLLLQARARGWLRRRKRRIVDMLRLRVIVAALSTPSFTPGALVSLLLPQPVVMIVEAAASAAVAHSSGHAVANHHHGAAHHGVSGSGHHSNNGSSHPHSSNGGGHHTHTNTNNNNTQSNDSNSNSNRHTGTPMAFTYTHNNNDDLGSVVSAVSLSSTSQQSEGGDPSLASIVLPPAPAVPVIVSYTPPPLELAVIVTAVDLQRGSQQLFRIDRPASDELLILPGIAWGSAALLVSIAVKDELTIGAGSHRFLLIGQALLVLKDLIDPRRPLQLTLPITQRVWHMPLEGSHSKDKALHIVPLSAMTNVASGAGMRSAAGTLTQAGRAQQQLLSLLSTIAEDQPLGYIPLRYLPQNPVTTLCMAVYAPPLDILRRSSDLIKARQRRTGKKNTSGNNGTGGQMYRNSRYWIGFLHMQLLFYQYYGDREPRLVADLREVTAVVVKDKGRGTSLVNLSHADGRLWLFECNDPTTASTLEVAVNESRRAFRDDNSHFMRREDFLESLMMGLSPTSSSHGMGSTAALAGSGTMTGGQPWQCD